MSSNTVSVSHLQRRLHALVADLPAPLSITQRGQVKAVLLSIKDYNKLIDELDHLQRGVPATTDAHRLSSTSHADSPPRDAMRNERG